MTEYIPPDKAISIVKALLPKLDAAGRAEVKQLLQALSQFDPVITIKRGKVDHAADDEGIVLASFHRVMIANGLDHSTPFVMKRLSGYKAFKDKVPGLIKFARNAAPNRVVQLAVLDLGWGLVHRYMTSMQIAVTPQAVMNHAHMMVPCVEQAFPGYIRNGLLKFVVTTE